MRDLTYPAVIVTAKTLFKVLGQRFVITGAEHVPTSGGALMAFNHIGYVDFVYGGLAAQPSDRLVRFMAKREIFDHPVGGPVMRSFHHIEVDRADGIASYRNAVDFLRRGEVVGIFPEATISRSMEIKELKTGAARIAAEAGVPLIPVVMWGTQHIWTKDRPRDFSRGTTISLTVGAPLHPTGDDPAGDTAALRTQMQRLLAETIEAYPDGRPPGAWWLPASHGGGAPTPEEAERLDAEEKRARAKRRAEKARKRSS